MQICTTYDTPVGMCLYTIRNLTWILAGHGGKLTRRALRPPSRSAAEHNTAKFGNLEHGPVCYRMLVAKAHVHDQPVDLHSRGTGVVSGPYKTDCWPGESANYSAACRPKNLGKTWGGGPIMGRKI